MHVFYNVNIWSDVLCVLSECGIMLFIYTQAAHDPVFSVSGVHWKMQFPNLWRESFVNMLTTKVFLPNISSQI